MHPVSLTINVLNLEQNSMCICRVGIRLLALSFLGICKPRDGRKGGKTGLNEWFSLLT